MLVDIAFRVYRDKQKSKSVIPKRNSAMSDNLRFRSCAFTINNYGSTTWDDLCQLHGRGGIKYLVFQKETGPSGTPHIQGYCSSQSARTRASWCTLLGGHAHVASARGTAEENKKYCTKEDTRDAGTEPAEYGELPSQGRRSDIDAVYALAREGASERDIAEADPTSYIKYSTGIKRVLLLHQCKRSWKTNVFWWYGSTGTGKSREAIERFPDAYWKPGSTKWWDGYDGESDVIIDDYRRDLCTFAELLRLLDRYPLVVEQKGGSRQFVARNVVITTPRSPRDTWIGRTDEDLAQLERRIEEVRCFGPEPTPRNFVESFNPAN